MTRIHSQLSWCGGRGSRVKRRDEEEGKGVTLVFTLLLSFLVCILRSISGTSLIVVISIWSRIAALSNFMKRKTRRREKREREGESLNGRDSSFSIFTKKQMSGSFSRKLSHCCFYSEYHKQEKDDILFPRKEPLVSHQTRVSEIIKEKYYSFKLSLDVWEKNVEEPLCGKLILWIDGLFVYSTFGNQYRCGMIKWLFLSSIFYTFYCDRCVTVSVCFFVFVLSSWMEGFYYQLTES